MWIRSQDKKKLVKPKGLFINNSQIWLGVESINGNEDGQVLLGEYPTEERAIEVMNQIQNCLVNGASVNNYEYFSNDPNYIETVRHCEAVFVMPKE